MTSVKDCCVQAVQGQAPPDGRPSGESTALTRVRRSITLLIGVCAGCQERQAQQKQGQGGGQGAEGRHGTGQDCEQEGLPGYSCTRPAAESGKLWWISGAVSDFESGRPTARLVGVLPWLCLTALVRQCARTRRTSTPSHRARLAVRCSPTQQSGAGTGRQQAVPALDSCLSRALLAIALILALRRISGSSVIGDAT